MGENGFSCMDGIEGGCNVLMLLYLKTACSVLGISGGGAGGLGGLGSRSSTWCRVG